MAQRYLSSHLGLQSFAARYAQALSQRYVAIPPDMMFAAAEGYLRHLSEAETEDAHMVLHAYAYLRTCTDGQGNPRRMRRLFSSELDGTRTPEFSAERAARDFKPFIYMIRLKPELAAPAGWGWERIEDGEWLRDLPALEVSLFDGL